ncbi:MAG: hypothetical protein K2J63_04855, partial [Muribaculaceae bacterium]|nr:hypothetical protein [Muribaculaceae bacterium]
FQTIIKGSKVYFMQANCLHSARCYYMSDEFAAVLGFSDAQRLRRVLDIRRARRFISVDGLRRRINVYATRSMDLQPLPEYMRKRARRHKN